MPHHLDDHEDDESRRHCPRHDLGKHWIDDLAYTQENTRLPVPTGAPTFRDMLEVIRQSAPEDNPSVYRFALVFVDGETGGINCLSSAGLEVSSTINLLSRAISIIAFQDMRAERGAMNIVSGLVTRLRNGYRQEPQMREPPESLGGYL